MNYDLSVCVFIKDTFKGAFCLFESMAQLMPLADEFIVMDLGSTDGTLEVLKDIESTNPKVRIVHDTFYKQDASVFAELANKVIAECKHKRILYYQSDEIWHEKLTDITKDMLETDAENLSFWRYQLRYNFQRIKWFPHIVHRIGTKESLKLVDDGMNTQGAYGVKMVTSKNEKGKDRWGSEHFLQWGDRYKHNPEDLPTHEMILDVSLTGGFLENIPDRRKMHAPFWNEDPINPSMPADEESMPLDRWIARNRNDENWHKKTTPFDIPQIMQYHIGKQRYELRPSLLKLLKVRSAEEWR